MQCHLIPIRIRRRESSSEEIHLSDPLRQYSHLMGGDKRDRLGQCVALVESRILDYAEWDRMYATGVDCRAISCRVARLYLISSKGPRYLKPLYSRACRWAEGQ